jgi:hypothetical protein
MGDQMGTHELTDLMHAGAQAHAAGGPDLASIHRRGARRRRTRQVATGGAALLTAAVVAGAVAVGIHGGGDPAGGRTAQAAAQDHHVTGLTAYEKRVLREVPGSYAVDGTVIVPGSAAGGGIGAQEVSPDRIASPVRPLGFHAYAGGAIGGDGLPRFMQGNPPKDSQVVADEGPVYLGCTTWPSAKGCTVSVLDRDGGTYHYVYGLGTERFLAPGAGMEVFTAEDYTGRAYHATLIGGFDGTEATRVDVTTVDGQVVPATVDRGTISDGDTLFWATLPADAASVTAYDADGKVVATHRVRSCTDPVDCEVR